MTASHDLERRLADHYATEVPLRAPDRVLDAVLATVDSTSQRRVLVHVPWRFPRMNTYAKWAIAAVVVVAVGALGLALLRPSSAPSVGNPGVPSPSPSPSPSPDPSAPPPLAESFTSAQHGITMSYPTGWTVKGATEPWTPTSLCDHWSPCFDNIYDPRFGEAGLFFGLGSQPLAGKTADEWVTGFLAEPDNCGSTESITIDDAEGRMCDQLAAVSTGDRGYFVRLYTSDAIPSSLQPIYGTTWFRTVLDTVRLHPEDAVDASPSASAS